MANRRDCALHKQRAVNGIGVDETAGAPLQTAEVVLLSPMSILEPYGRVRKAVTVEREASPPATDHEKPIGRRYWRGVDRGALQSQTGRYSQNRSDSHHFGYVCCGRMDARNRFSPWRALFIWLLLRIRDNEMARLATERDSLQSQLLALKK